jgi:hypothetical protein
MSAIRFTMEVEMNAEKIKGLRGLIAQWRATNCRTEAQDRVYRVCADQLEPLLAALLDEVEALRAALGKAATHIAAIGYPVGANGRYQKGGEWTFSDACPREADAAEVKRAFLTLSAARHEPKGAER